jgi:type 2 lantibiotic biosynthesis protein LanM
VKLDKKVDFFNEFYQRHMGIFESQLVDVCKKIGFTMEYSSVKNYIYEELLAISRMLLIFELHRYRENGLLTGNTSEERYYSFCQITGTDEFDEYIMKTYPVLKYLFQQKMDHAIKCIDSIYKHFINDQEALEQIFGIKFSEIYDIEIGHGDIHECGKTIAILTGDFGKIVYKSRNLSNDLALNKVIDFLNQSRKIKFPLKNNLILCRSDYGWQEFIETRECKDIKEVDKFYYRAGCHLAIFYIFNSGDMHYENIITDGEYPRIIDTETLVTLSKFKNIDDIEEIHNFPMDNVLSTCFLPYNDKSDMMDVDMSGLSGGNIKSEKIKEYNIENYGTDHMKLVRKYINHTMNQANIPRVVGKQVDVSEWKEHLIKGFEDAMNVFIQDKEQLVQCIIQSDIKDSQQRQLFRNTYAYAKFLETSCYPTYLSSFDERKKLFEKMRNPENLEDKRIEHEITLLNKGYIPAYYSLFASKDLCSCGEIIQKDYFNQSGSDTVKYKIASLSPDTIRLQKHIINLSYMTLIKDIISKPAVNERNIAYYENSIVGATSIFKSIEENILINPDDGLHDLYMLRLGENSQSLQGLDLSLYEGGGLIWAIYNYAKEKGDEQLVKKCLSMLESTIKKQEKKNTSESLSIYAGMGSDIYILFNIYMDTRETKYYSLFQKSLQKIEERLDTLEEIDYMHGISGYVVLLSKILSKRNDEYVASVLLKACKVLEKLIASYKTEVAGIAHGGAGVALALSFVEQFNGKGKYLDIIETILNEEKAYIDEENIFWCRGTGGIALAKAGILKNLQHRINEPAYQRIANGLDEDIEHLLSVKFDEMDNLCLCHGIYGYYDIIKVFLCEYGNILAKDKIDRLKKRMESVKKELVVVTAKKLWINSEYMLDTFMLGASGVGYAMLRLHNNKYPSILNLDMIQIGKGKKMPLLL